MDLRPSPEKLLGRFLPFLPGYHLHNWQRKLQRPFLRLPFRKRSDGDSVAIWEWIRKGLKVLTINTDALGFRVAHFLQLNANFVELDGLLAGGQGINIHNVKIVSDKAGRRLPQASQLCVTI